MNGSKDEQIFQKDGYPNVSSARSLVPHPIFCDQDFLDMQDGVSYSSSIKRMSLSENFALTLGDSESPV